jgi:hypothetical protein
MRGRLGNGEKFLLRSRGLESWIINYKCKKFLSYAKIISCNGSFLLMDIGISLTV